MRELIHKYRESINQPTKPHGFLTLAGTFAIFLTLPLITMYLDKETQTQTQKINAQENLLNREDNKKNDAEFISNELLIKVKKASKNKVKEGNAQNTGIDTLDKIGKRQKIKHFEKIAKAGKKANTDADIFSWYVVTFDEKEEKISGKFDNDKGILESDKPAALTIKENLARLRSDKDIETAEPNFIVTTNQVVPNDPYYTSSGTWGQAYPDLWGLKKINMETAWTQTTGSSSIVVAGIDTGVDRNHEDLSSNMWINTGETPGNNIDDDGNGYIDDYYGWDFANNDNNPMDDHGHGTHTAGTIAATGNNSLGVVGVTWQSKIMALKFLNSSGSGSTSNAIKALQYAADMGAKVSSNSWGGKYYSTALDDAIKYEHDRGMIIVVAAGNSNSDALDYSPASADYAITVAASDPNDLKASFSNWGEKIDVAAPGVDVLSTRAATNPMCTAAKTVGTNYCRVSGTSMATPHIAGLVALLLTKNPALTTEEVRQIIRVNAADLGTAGRDGYFGYGRIDSGNTLTNSSSKPLAPIITSPISRNLISATRLQVIGTAAGENFASYKIEIGAGRSPAIWTIVNQSTTQVNNGVLATIDTSDYSDGLYTIRLTATDTLDKSYQFQVFDVTVDNFDAAIQFPIGFVSKGVLDIIGTAQVKNALIFGSYKIEWGQGAAPATWSTDGITLKNSGTLPATEALLATWNTSSLASEQIYTLRLTVNATNGKTVEYGYQVTIDKDMVSNWPKYIPGRGDGYDYVVPVLSDLDGDGSKEIIALETTINAGKIHVFKKNGAPVPGFPFNLLAGDYSPHWSVNIEDLDNDGRKEIIFVGSLKVYVVKSDGTNYTGWPKNIFESGSNGLRQDRTPIAVDLNRDGKKELTVMDRVSFDATAKTATFKLHALKLDGTELTGFPKTYTFPIENLHFDDYASLSASDMDNDGLPELGFGYYRSFYLFDNNGNLLPGWPYLAPLSTASDGPAGVAMVFESPGAFGDIDADGAKELFTLSIYDGICFSGCKSRVYGWKKDGTILSAWPKQAGSPNWTDSTLHAPSIADLDENNADEVLVGAIGIYAFDSTGLKFTEDSEGFPAQSAPAIRDVNGDGKLEISSVNYRNIAVVTDNGQYYWQRNFPNDGHWFMTPGVFADMDNNGRTEYTAFRGPQFYNDKISSLYLWELPLIGSTPAENDWPMFLHDSARTGRLSNSATLPTPMPTSTPANTPIPTNTPNPIPTNTPIPTLQPTNTPTPIIDTPPSVTITYPSDGAKIKRNTTINITASASDNIAVKKVEFYVNNTLKCSDTTFPYSCSYRLGSGAGTTYTVQAKAFDSANQTATYTIQIAATK